MLMPIRKSCSARNSHHSSSSRVPFVCIVCRNVMPGRRVALGDLDGPPVEVDPHQRRLASLPGDRHVRCLVGIDQLHDVALEHRRRTSGTGRPRTAAPCRGRSSTSTRGCRSHRSASPGRGPRQATTPARSAASNPVASDLVRRRAPNARRSEEYSRRHSSGCDPEPQTVGPPRRVGPCGTRAGHGRGPSRAMLASSSSS